MATKAKTRLVPRVPRDIQKSLATSENGFVANAATKVDEFNEFCCQLPLKYGWRFRTVDALRAEVRDLIRSNSSPRDINELYWRDLMGNWEAYSIMSTFRLMQFSKSCLWALGRRDLACACVIARAMLENSAAFVDAARTVHATISKSTPFPDLNSDFDNTFVTSTALEEYCLKVVFASRLPESDDIYSSTNVLTILKRISKNSQADFLYRTYELLSEVSHPNWAARSFHISDSKAGDWKGNELRTITHAADAGWPVILEPTVAALSWSSAAQISAFQLMSEAIALVLARFPESR